MGATELLASEVGAEATSRLLTDVPRAFGTQIMDALMTALVGSVGTWMDAPGVVVNVEGHGRDESFEGANLFATVGWFTTLYPVYVPAMSSDIAASLEATQASLAAIPGKGLGFGVLKYMSAVGDRLRALPQPEISFNYFGQMDATYSQRGRFRPNFGYVGELMSPRTPRAHLIELNTSVTHGRLRSQWIYSRDHFKPSTIERLADSFNATLQAIVAALPGDPGG